MAPVPPVPVTIAIPFTLQFGFEVVTIEIDTDVAG